jgi:hypothetical protein
MKGNQILTENGLSYIIIIHRDGSETRVTIDTKNIPKVVGLTWGITCGYATTQIWSAGRGSTKVLYYLHRYLMGLPPYGEPAVDHKDRDRLNCTEQNLRIATRSQNQTNQVRRDSEHRGVSCVRRVGGRCKYTAHIQTEGILLHLGTFDTAEEASAVYEAKEAELHGEFKPKN